MVYVNYEENMDYKRYFVNIYAAACYTCTSYHVDPAWVLFAEKYSSQFSVTQFPNITCISGGNPRPKVELQSMSPANEWRTLTNVTACTLEEKLTNYWIFRVPNITDQTLKVRCQASNSIPPPAATGILTITISSKDKCLVN